jgi:hypothetical protein
VDAARRSWIPVLEFSGGAQRNAADVGGGAHLVAGISFELPLLSRGQGLSAIAAAAQRAAQARLGAAQTATKIAIWRAEAELTAAGAELQRLGAASSGRAMRIERAAQIGYREGTESLDGLLDVGRVSTALARRLLQLSLAAKLAEVALRAARGEFE